MIFRVFLDANVLFSAVLSSEGRSREIVRLLTEGTITALISEQVMVEVKRTLLKKYPELFDRFIFLLERSRIQIVADPDNEAVETLLMCLPYPPDAAVLAAAQSVGADYLVTGDKAHFLSRPDLGECVGFPIVSPRQFLEILDS